MDSPTDVPKVVFNDLILSLDVELDDEFREKGRIEIRETPELAEQSLKELRELIQEEPDLNVPLDEKYLTKFLRPCKWYPNSALSLMKRCYRFKLKHPQICDLSIEPHMDIVHEGFYLPLPLRDRNGSRILFATLGKSWNPKIYSLSRMFTVLMIYFQSAIEEPKTQIAGLQAVVNLDGFSLSQATYITPSFAAMLAEWVQRCMPLRLKGIHIVNQPFFFNMVYAIFKPFLQEKTKKRIVFHGRDRASLFSHFEPEILPTTVDGRIDISNPNITKSLAEFHLYFKDKYTEGSKYGYTKAEK